MFLPHTSHLEEETFSSCPYHHPGLGNDPGADPDPTNDSDDGG